MRTMQTSLSGCFWKDVEQAEEGRGWQWVSNLDAFGHGKGVLGEVGKGNVR